MISKQCVQCSKTFQVTDQDLEFYQRIVVPQPTLCPDCRQQRRLMWRNERFLHERKCDLCRKSIIATYPAGTPFPVYCQACWWGEGWDSTTYGRDIDWSRPVFEQFRELLQVVPRVNLVASNNVNSPYVNYTNYSGDCYLINGGHHDERCMYGWRVVESKDCVDNLQVNKSELCYFGSDLTNCYNVNFSSQVSSSHDCAFVFDVKGSSDCFMSSNLRNAHYVFMNKQLTQVEYEQAITKYPLQSYNAQQAAWTEFENLLIRDTIHKPLQTINADQSSGDNMVNVKNCQQSYNIQNSENCSYTYYSEALRDAYDCTFSGWPAELMYENLSGAINCNNVKFGVVCWSCHDVQYSENCHNCHDVFASIGLRKAQFTILNKIYSETDYKVLQTKLIEYMKTTGEYGEFFPANCSPYAYNETLAQDMYPVTAEYAQQQNWRWQTDPKVAVSRQTIVVPDTIAEVTDAMTQQTIACGNCQKHFRLTTAEVKFHRQTNLAISPWCYNCRFTQLMRLRTALALWQRQCMCTQTDHSHHGRCATEFATTYSPERKELVYCEQCYTKEVY